ncbi:MAG: peptidoglycan DD-metalloendopeptidase family protein [Candidatus Odinarchaeum yellowstonii]|uniref:Peptidoglycan DD-metalloendopeptidase family protein n=1 Tax=Odinarchaeota yellowstonii (strain LCB_4) TaxID=1841599 RepID=A0AAF0IDE3_ODILC|nr:MAG: peptidoglycan DD-metalloendopeptidase family protein [Candidatus Odinarchaeum yellowstonii]
MYIYEENFLAGLGAVVIVACVSGFVVWNIISGIPDTLPLDQDPQLILPLYDYSNLTMIQGYGQVEPDRFHNGFDFTVNDTTIIVAPCEAYVQDISFFENEAMNTWQTNLRLRLNSRWSVIIAFESWALNETYGRYQLDAIIVKVGDHVAANQTIGELLHHGSGSHIHFGIIDSGEWVCPYQYFTAEAQSTFQHLYVDMGLGWPAGDWCK